MRLKLVVVGIAALVAALSVTGLAVADAERHDSKVILTGHLFAQSIWLGEVKSDRQCERKRKVTVFKRNPGLLDAPVASGKTKRSGRFKLFDDAPENAVYYAVVKKRVLGSGDNKVICQRDRSPNHSES